MPTQLRDEQRARRLEKRFEAPMLVAALLVVPVVAIEASHVSHGWKTFGAVLNWIVWRIGRVTPGPRVARG